jgi:hypothetical protein
MKGTKRKIGECVYCGEIKPLTLDHIPPKNLFPKQKRNNLVKVPSCDNCHGQNKRVSLDDEYFRTMLIQRHDVLVSPSILEVRDTVICSLNKPEKSGFRNSFLRSTRLVDLYSKGRIFLGKGITYQVDLSRLSLVAKRIILGLFYYQKKYRLPNNYKVHAAAASGIQLSSREKLNDLIGKIRLVMAGRKKNIVDKEVFSYYVVFTNDDPNVSQWVLIFYNRIVFIGFTLPCES